MVNRARAFKAAVGAENWQRAVDVGRPLIHAQGCAIETYQQLCLALEHTGRWLELAPVAELGVNACEASGVNDDRLCALLKSLGRGLYDRQQYVAGKLAYERLRYWAERNNRPREIWQARYSVACCLERMGRQWWPGAVSEYQQAVQGLPDHCEKLAATSNWAYLLDRMGRPEEAYDVATTAVLMCPSDQRNGAAWADLLRVLAHLEIERDRPDVALMTIIDAIETTPDNRPGVLSLAHAVRALAEAHLGNYAEAGEAIELAWTIAGMAPSARACELLRGVETALREEGIVS